MFTTTPATDDLDRMTFGELMQLAKLHKVPGRGTARIGQLREGVRAARAGDATAYRVAQASPAPVATPAVPLPGRAAVAVEWRGRVSADGRWAVLRREEQPTQGRTTGRVSYLPVNVRSGEALGPAFSRLRDAQVQVQRHVEDLERAFNSAVACERARVAGVPEWVEVSTGMMLRALAEDAHRARLVAASQPKRLSGFGALAAAHRSAHGLS